MNEGQRPSLRELISEKLQDWDHRIQGATADPRAEAVKVGSTPERLAPYDGFVYTVKRVEDALSLSTILGLETDKERELYHQQLIVESALKITARPSITNPHTGTLIDLNENARQKWQKLYCKPRQSTDLGNATLVMLEGEITAAAKSTVARFFTPEYGVYGELLIERLTGSSNQPLNLEELKRNSIEHCKTLEEDLALKRHATQISRFRQELSSKDL